MWSRSALLVCSKLPISTLKVVLPMIAFYFLSGPWRTAWCRLGHDPRKDKESRMYQVVDFRMRNSKFISIVLFYFVLFYFLSCTLMCAELRKAFCPYCLLWQQFWALIDICIKRLLFSIRQHMWSFECGYMVWKYSERDHMGCRFVLRPWMKVSYHVSGYDPRIYTRVMVISGGVE